MSDNSDTTDDGGNDSLFTNFKNKMKYKIHKAAYDPNANKFADEQAKKKKEEEEKKKDDNTTTDDKDDDSSSDPHKFSAKRLAKKVGNKTLDILKKIFFPFLAVMLAMIVTNELIIYSVPIRVVFFIFTIAICIYSQNSAIGLALYYIFKGSYSYYVNNMTDRPKKDIMPTIFALLPVTTYKPMSSFSSFFLYPFTYPKTELAAQKLPEVMKEYWQSLLESFKDFDKIKNLPIFVEDIKHIQYDLARMHDIKGPAINFKEPKNSVNGQLLQEAQHLPGARAELAKQTSAPVPPKPSAPPATANSTPAPATANENNNPK